MSKPMATKLHATVAAVKPTSDEFIICVISADRFTTLGYRAHPKGAPMPPGCVVAIVPA